MNAGEEQRAKWELERPARESWSKFSWEIGIGDGDPKRMYIEGFLAAGQRWLPVSELPKPGMYACCHVVENGHTWFIGWYDDGKWIAVLPPTHYWSEPLPPIDEAIR